MDICSLISVTGLQDILTKLGTVVYITMNKLSVAKLGLH